MIHTGVAHRPDKTPASHTDLDVRQRSGDPPSGAHETTTTVVGLSHNIPKVLPPLLSFVAGLRVRNTGRTSVHVPAQHTLFWAARSSAAQHAVYVNLDGQFLLHAQVPDARLCARRSTTIFFPLHSGAEGQHRLQVFLASAAGAQADANRRILFDVVYRVTSKRTTLALSARLRTWAFMLRRAQLPRLADRFRCCRARAAFLLASRPDRRREHLRRLKDENRRLAFLEKQTRTLRVASRPCYITLDSTVACNLRCPRCYREDAEAAKVLPTRPDMRDDVMDDIIRSLLPTAITLSPSGLGEPLMSPHLDKLLETCATYGVLMSLTTNGVLLNKKGLLDRLIPVLHWLEISFDSVNPQLFERLRAGARFEQVLGNARAVGRIRSFLSRAMFHFGFSMTLYNDNLREIPGMIRLVSDCGGDFLKTDIGVIFNRTNLRHSVLRSPRAYNDVYAPAQQCAKEFGVRLFMRPPFVEDDRSEARRYGVCDFLYTHASIATDGSYRPCYSSILPSRRSVARPDVLGLWNSADMRRLRRDHDMERAPVSCKTCYMTLTGRDSLAGGQARFIRGDAACVE